MILNTVDIIILVILALAFIDGYRKGFVASVSNLVCTIVALVGAKMYFLKGAELLATYTPLSEKVLEFVRKSNVVENLLKANMPTMQKMGVTQAFSGDLKAFATVLIFNAVAFVITFLVFRILLGVIEMILSGLMEIPGLKEINSLFGSVISLAKAGLFLMIFCSVIVPATSILNKPGVMKAVNDSIIITFLSKYNFILGWLWKTALSVMGS